MQDPAASDQAQLNPNILDQAWQNADIGQDVGDGAPDPLLTATGIGSQAQNSPRSMGNPASHISVPSAGSSRNATGVGSAQGNRSRSRTRSRTRSRSPHSPIRSSTPRADVPGAVGGRARQGQGPNVRAARTGGNSTRRGARTRGNSTRGGARRRNDAPTDRQRNRRDTEAQYRLWGILRDQDEEQLAQGREIKNITVTNSIVTSYKEGGRPTVRTNSASVAP